MSEPMEFTIGSEVACTDGACGDLRRVVIDPIARAITHLVVEPRHRRDAGHLVPIDLVTSTVHQIQLRCTKSEFDALEAAEETQFLPGAGQQLGYKTDQTLVVPYFALGIRGMSVQATETRRLPKDTNPHASTYDHVPTGEVEVRRGDHVEATDGPVGRVQGLVIDPGNRHVTHFLLDEGHLWGKKRVAIPINAVARAGEVIRLKLSKDEVGELPEIEVHHPG